MGDRHTQQRSADFDRRAFLRRSTAALAASGIWASESFDRQRVAAADADMPSAGDLIAGKDPRLIVHGTEPAELETPLALLAEHRVTPTSLLFVRNNQSLAGAANLKPAAADGWTVEIGGLVSRPATVAVADLARMAHVEHELVLQCSGNGRAMFSAAAPAKGAPWQCGAMGNVRFAGVPLAKVLDRLGVKPNVGARFLTAEGRDAPAKSGEPDFEHSIPLADALERSILALSLNGEPIPAAHGGPVRLVTPGYYATMNVKWLGRLRLEGQETTNYHQVRRYRTPKEPIRPGSEFTYDLANSDANWRMRTKSIIFAPLDGQRVKSGPVGIRGVAWNDGAAPIETVLLATSPSGAWQPAKIELSKSPYAWQHWTAEVTLAAGDQTIMARAIDGLGRSQPIAAAAHWNPAGYAFNGVHTVKVLVE
ncbi:MAG: sulfite oxidase [Planctomycetia bacterium]|nr:sulfite oxidase [Planctomycetia bacterium]